MTRSDYYESLKHRAREVRQMHGLSTPRVTRSDMRRIYKKEGIAHVDLWPPAGAPPSRFRVLRGAYFNDEFGATVLLPRQLPIEPTIFSMAHELKHHLTDQESIGLCLSTQQSDMREIGAEIFAAEFIFPEDDFRREMTDRGFDDGACTAEQLVRLKAETATTLSYAALVKRAEWCKFSPKGALARTKWRQVEQEVFGRPIHRPRRRVGRHRR